MNIPKRFILKIVLTVIVGAIGSLWYLSRDPRCIKMVHDKITLLFEKKCGLHFSGTISSLSFFDASIKVENIILCSLSSNKQWSIKIKKSTFTFSLLHYLLHHKVGVALDLDECTLFSKLKNKEIALVTELRNLFSQPGSLPFELLQCTCSKNSLYLQDSHHALDFFLRGDLIVKQENNTYQCHYVIKDGKSIVAHKTLLSDLAGTITFDICPTTLSCTLDISCALPLLFKNDDTCHVTGQWQNQSGTFSCYTDSQSLQCHDLSIKTEDDKTFAIKATGSVAFASCMEFVHFPYPAHVSGNLAFALNGILGADTQNLIGTIDLKESQLAGWSIDHIQTSFEYAKDSCKGSLIYHQKNERLLGTWAWDAKTKLITFLVTNSTPFSLFGTNWYLPEKLTTLRGKFSSVSGEGTIKYQVACEQEKTETFFKSHGTIQCKNNTYTATGAILAGDSLYYLEASKTADPISKENSSFMLKLIDKQGEHPVTMATILHKESHTEAQIELSIVQNIIRDYTQTTLLGNGSLKLQGTWHGSELQGNIELKNGMLRIPSVYNFIHDIQADFFCNFLKRTLSCKNVKVSLQKGTLESAFLQVGFDPITKGIWAHLPLTFTDCFINWKKDLYTLFSGAFVAKKIPGSPLSVEGFAILDHSQFKENIFSQKLQQLLMDTWSSPTAEKTIHAHIALSTRSPLAIKTEQLETNAQLSLMLDAQAEQTTITGTITLQGGAIHFPAHSLSITKGKLIFIPEQADDPFLEVTAQARIKKYLITLSMGGTGQDPELVFDSVPALSEEQIMMLLIAGSEEESLNIVAPTLVMRNIENVIFGSSYRSRTDTWLEPLKRIRFVPRFTDQTGRGGFKGALEIEVSKRLRALIEKNFSLTEDVAFEVEYLLTDDVTLRGSYDERSDLGAEIEMRFKF